MHDMTVPCGDGLLNIRVGAIIMEGGQVLMVKSADRNFYYSVGGRVQMGETAREAVEREVLEETGVPMAADRLGFVHENYFYGDMPATQGKLIYEISFFFYMKVPEDFVPVAGDLAQDRLECVDLDSSNTLYPDFFKTELKHPTEEIRHFLTDERQEAPWET